MWLTVPYLRVGPAQGVDSAIEDRINSVVYGPKSTEARSRRSSSSIASLRSRRYRRYTVPSVPTVPALRARSRSRRVRPFIIGIGPLQTFKRSTASLRSNRLGTKTRKLRTHGVVRPCSIPPPGSTRICILFIIGGANRPCSLRMPRSCRITSI